MDGGDQQNRRNEGGESDPTKHDNREAIGRETFHQGNPRTTSQSNTTITHTRPTSKAVVKGKGGLLVLDWAPAKGALGQQFIERGEEEGAAAIIGPHKHEVGHLGARALIFCESRVSESVTKMGKGSPTVTTIKGWMCPSPQPFSQTRTKPSKQT